MYTSEEMNEVRAILGELKSSVLDRDYWRHVYAGEMMKALLTDPGPSDDIIDPHFIRRNGITNKAHFSHVAVAFADALLEQLEATK